MRGEVAPARRVTAGRRGGATPALWAAAERRGGARGSGAGVRGGVAPARLAAVERRGRARGGRPSSAVRRATQEMKCGDEGRGCAGRA